MDPRWMEAALALAERAGTRASPNPAVGCVLVKEGRLVARAATAAGGRPHAEAAALAAAGPAAAGATAYVTLEPCAHASPRGPDCAGLLAAAGVAEVAIALEDPDPRTAGAGAARLEAAGVRVHRGVGRQAALLVHAAWLVRQRLGRPHWTVKLAMSLDGRLAAADGRSQWITGERARLWGHRLRARADAVVVGRGTLAADRPQLSVRLPGWTGRQPARALLSASAGSAPPGWRHARTLDELHALALSEGWMSLLAEAGPGLAAALLHADVADRLALLRAPVLLGGAAGLGPLAAGLDSAHGRWQAVESRRLGEDRLELFERRREGICSQAS